jgi:hypothetical protein
LIYACASVHKSNHTLGPYWMSSRVFPQWMLFTFLPAVEALFFFF